MATLDQWAILAVGFDLLLTDVDVDWVCDPHPLLLASRAPFLVQRNYPQHQVNTGFAYM